MIASRLLLVPVLMTALICSIPGRAAEKPSKIKLLYVTGDDVKPAHDWLEVATATRAILEDSGKFEVVVCEDTGILDSKRSLDRYDVVYLALYNAHTPTLSDVAKRNLLNFVKGGKGFVVTHLGSASFKEWSEFRELCGRYWVMGKSGHGPRGVFKVEVVDDEHPITGGVEDFEADDELYAKLQGDAPIHVLVTAYSDWSKGEEPLAFIRTYGQGRVFHHTFGHDGKALDNRGVERLIVQGSEWAAKGAVR